MPASYCLVGTAQRLPWDLRYAEGKLGREVPCFELYMLSDIDLQMPEA